MLDFNTRKEGTAIPHRPMLHIGRCTLAATMEIRRDFYLDKLIKRKNNGLIKVITGIRRCGKSYLLNNLFYHHLLESGVDADHIIRFAFDSADDLYLIGESLLQIEKEKRGVDPEKFMAYIRSKVVG